MRKNCLYTLFFFAFFLILLSIFFGPKSYAQTFCDDWKTVGSSNTCNTPGWQYDSVVFNDCEQGQTRGIPFFDTQLRCCFTAPTPTPTPTP